MALVLDTVLGTLLKYMFFDGLTAQYLSPQEAYLYSSRLNKFNTKTMDSKNVYCAVKLIYQMYQVSEWFTL